MTIPSGSGTETLQINLSNTTGSGDTVLVNGVNNHIYTILSCVICETVGNAETFSLYVKNDGSTIFYLVKDQALAAKKTFVFNDRIVLVSTDELAFAAGGTCDIDIVTSYIDQDWT